MAPIAIELEHAKFSNVKKLKIRVVSASVFLSFLPNSEVFRNSIDLLQNSIESYRVIKSHTTLT